MSVCFWLHVLVIVPLFFRTCIPIFVFFSFIFFVCVCMCVHPADLHVGEPWPGIRGEEGGASPLTAARTGGSSQCGFCRPRDGGDVHLPLATGALRVSVWPARLVQHRG